MEILPRLFVQVGILSAGCLVGCKPTTGPSLSDRMEETTTFDGNTLNTTEDASAAGGNTAVEPPGESSESTTSEGRRYFKPQAEVLDSLERVPEVIVDLRGRQGYIPYATDKWLYFSGYLDVGPGVFRTKKEPGAEPEKVIDGFLTNIANFFYEDGMMYLLSEYVLYRWPEDAPERLEEFTLEKAHFRFKSDADHFIAITYSSQDVTLFDKQTLQPHTIHLEELPTGMGGGAYDVASDGDRIYCTRYNIPGLLYVVNKKTEEVQRFELPPFEQFPDSPIGLAGFFVEDQRLYGNFYSLNYFGYIDTRTGTPVALAAPNGWQGRTDPVLREAGTDYVYFGDTARNGGIHRYNYKNFTALPLLAAPSGLLQTHGFSMDSTHVYFVTLRNPAEPSAPVGILRVPKPQ